MLVRLLVLKLSLLLLLLLVLVLLLYVLLCGGVKGVVVCMVGVFFRAMHASVQ